MTPRFLKSWKSDRHAVRLRRKPRFLRLFVEPLEDRTMLDATLPPDIIVGRTLSTYSTTGVQNHTLTVTYTVYNEQADDVTGVLLTDTLQAGVTVQSASQLPDQSGQNLAWSLGTIHGFDRASITLTVTLPNVIPTQIDTGAHAFGILNAGMVTNDTPAATLVTRTLPADQLASTPDANTTDPFIQEEAAKLRYDPQAIFNYLNTDVGYESYVGSLRGARGTLWSAAGNSLDEASLGVALFRASGIPARYAHGTLSDPLSRQMILSMFPATFQTVGYIPPGTAVADPANDSQLLGETRDHYWLQIDTGAGFQDADTSGLPGGGIGTAFTTVAGTFTEVADNLRHKVEVKLDAEIYNSASALFGGLGGNGLSTSTVLDQSFNTVDLIGRPLSIGNLVTQSALGGLVFSSSTTTYTPYFLLGDEALPADLQPEPILGSQFQQVATNFPFGSTILTGLFLSLTLNDPGSAPVTYNRSLVDRIGYAARQGQAGVNVSVDPNGPPALTPFDLFTLNVLPASQSLAAAQLAQEHANKQFAALQAAANPTTVTQIGALIAEARAQLANYAATSDRETADLVHGYSLAAYFDTARITLYSVKVLTANDQSFPSFGIDLIRDAIRAVAMPGQNAEAARAFAAVRGIFNSYLEAQSIPVPSGGTNLSSTSLIDESIRQGIPLIMIGPDNISAIQDLNLPVDALAQITSDVQNGFRVAVPSRPVTVNGQPMTAWWASNPNTGEILARGQNGGNQGMTLLAASTLIVNVIVSAALNVAISSYTPLPPWLQTNPVKAATIGAVTGLVGNLFISFILNLAILYVLSPLGPLSKFDPPVAPLLVDLNIPYSDAPGASASTSINNPANRPTGAATGTVQVQGTSAAGQMSASWTNTGNSGFRIQTFSAAGASIVDGNGVSIGSGATSLALAAPIESTVSGSNNYSVSGTGSLNFYGPAESPLGVGANWASYSATVTGNVSITLTTDSLILNGTRLPLGTYTIATNSATFSGNGASSSPNFAGSASVTLTNGTVNFGPGNGTINVGGNPILPDNGNSLTGFTGSLAVAAGGGGMESVTLNGTAANQLSLVASPSTLTANQNNPANFQIDINTSLADTYTLSAQAPTGWTVTVDDTGKVTITTAPGLQNGTYPIRIVARSTTNADLVAQTIVNVTVSTTLPGVTLGVTPDTIYTVPFNGAEVPTAFRASVQNLGSDADTFDLTFSNLPAGFALQNSGTSVTVPAGQTGIVGLYLQPIGTLPAPGTVLSFTVIATSTSNPTITQSRTVTFTMPAVHAVTLLSTPSTVNSTPGVAGNATLSLQNVGNVSETVALSDVLPAGLAVAGLPASINLTPGQSTTIPLTLTPTASTPLNSNLVSTITATFGPAATPVTQQLQIQMRVVVPGADAIANASVAASHLGETDLANRLNDLSSALTNLVQSPGSDFFNSQALAALDALVRLLPGDPFTAPLAPTLSGDRTQLAAAHTAATVTAATLQLGTDLGTLATTLYDEAAHNFTLSLISNSAVVRPQVPTPFGIILQNIGSQTTTYDLSVSGLPSDVTATFSQSKITLAPGQVTPGSPGVPDVTITLTSTSATDVIPFSFVVRAVAEGATEIGRTTTGSLTARSEFVTVVSVSPTPAFTDPGGQVAVSAKLLNAVNREQAASALFTVLDAGSNIVFTSSPVSVALHLLTTLTTANLGMLDTTGFAKGDYTIFVTVSDAQGTPIPGATGSGHLLVGSPITASLTTDPTTLAPGNGTVTTTLQVTNTQPASGGLLTPLSTLAIPGAAQVQVYGNRAYVVGTGSIRVVDITDPTNPQILTTFGGSDIAAGLGVTGMELDGDRLVVTTGKFDANANAQVLVYSLADPSAPSLLGQSPLTFNGVDYTGMISDTIINHHVYTSSLFFRYFIAGQNVFGQYGESLVIDVTNPSAPAPVSVIFNRPPEPNFTYPDGLKWPDGSSNIWQSAEVNANTAYIATTANTKSTVDDIGQILVVDTTDPNNPNVVRTVNVPGMSVVAGISVVGNTAWIIGSTLGWRSGVTPLGLNGKIVIARLDVTDAQNPTIAYTKTFDTDSLGLGFLKNVGNGLFFSATYSVSGPNTDPGFFVFDTNDPNNVTLTSITLTSPANAFTADNNKVYTGDGTNLIIYQLGQPQTTPATASVTVPTADGVSVVPGSFSLTPTSTVTTAAGTTYEWDLAFDSATTSKTITWQETVTDLQPGHSRTVTTDGGVSFVSQGSNGQVALADQVVTGAQILGLTPPTQTIAPGAIAQFTVNLSNPTSSPVVYDLSVVGVPSGWVGIAPSVTVAANGTADVPLTLTPDSFAVTGDYEFAVTATAGGASGSVQGTLTLAGLPVLPDPDSHGIVIALTPSTATAGQGTSAQYVVRLTNSGSSPETFDLTASLPPGVTAVFGQSSVTVPPGAGNYRDVTLLLTPAAGTAPGNLPFSVTATSATSSATGSATGTIAVVHYGVSVSLNKSTGAPGDTFVATITNTGTMADTFALSVAGPAGLVASLGTASVTLAPGQSTTVPVTTGAMNFSVQGSVSLTVVAKSGGNAAVQGAASAGLLVGPTTGLAAAFQRNNQVIPIPGTADFLLLVNNTGNTEDAYSATITGTTGPVSASLAGLDGLVTQTIPIFRLPGLSGGAIVIHSTLLSAGLGTVTVKIQSLNNPGLSSTKVATLGVPQPTPVLVGGATNGTAVVYNPTNGQFGVGSTLTFFPGFAGEVRTATADVTGDGVPDFIGGTGVGISAEVAVIDGQTHQVIARFHPFESSFTLGVYVTAADLTGDGKAEVVVTPDQGGGPIVAVYDGAKLAQGLANGQPFGQPAQLDRFFGIEGDPNFRGGDRPSLGDMNGDQTPDLIVSAGFLGGPRIAVFDGNDLAKGVPTPHHLLPDFFAFEPTLRNGAFVAAGDITGDGKAELAFGGGPSGANRVRVFDVAQLLAAPPFASLDDAPHSAQLDNFFTGDPSLRGGVRLAIKPIDLSGKAALVAGSGNGEASQILVYTSATLLANSNPSNPDQTLDPFMTTLTNGVFVG
ncbi:MAG TPA: transglutaminase domain-containing protein [Fimbriiglobus sp.]|jgi:uncharacterized membrane protein